MNCKMLMGGIVLGTSSLLTVATASAALITNTFDDPGFAALWSVDRAAPGSFTIAGGELTMGINGADYTAPLDTSTNTQGMKLNIGMSNYVSIDMFIPAAWAGTSNRWAGLWAVGNDSFDDSISGYPVLEFQGAGAVDGANPAGVNSWDIDWTNIISSVTLNGWNTLTMTVDIDGPGTGTHYLVNGTEVYVDPYPFQNYFSEVILNAKNSGSSFNVRYDNLVYGVVPEPAPIALLGLGALFILRRAKK